jgi:hypothetical protein
MDYTPHTCADSGYKHRLLTCCYSRHAWVQQITLTASEHDLQFDPLGAYEDIDDTTMSQPNIITKEDLSVLRGESSLKATFTPPTSDLPLRSGDNFTTLSSTLLRR